MAMENDPIVKEVLKVSGFEKLNPPQELAVKAGLLDGKSMVVAAPTASGKTIIAEIAALKTVKEGRKVVYIVPLRALASEKYEEFKKKYEPLGIRVAISIGDMDSSDAWLANYDIIIVTSEKLDSLLRHEITWAGNIGLVVADEIHLLNDPDRGPTLEVTLTKLKQIINPTILGLSATISNYKELSSWLKAEGVKSDYRPIKLYRGVCFDNEVDFIPKRRITLSNKEVPLTELITQTLAKNKQALIFVNTRKGTESLAEKTGKLIKNQLKKEEITSLKDLSQKIEHSIESPTRQCRRLSACIINGAAFHHAGLVNKQRKLIEDGFKKGLIKIITATPTLAMGVNLPSFRIIIRDLKRFSRGRGMDYIPILEIEQMSGRAGRPSYDSEGEAILLPKNKAEAKYAWDNYIKGKPEKIYSKLSVEPVLRIHVLALIASGITPTKKDLFDFFSKTFYAFQYKDLSQLNFNLERVLNMLEDFKFITTGDSKREDNEFKTASSLMVDDKAELKPTRIGKRVSELYIDPVTANHLITSLGKMNGSVDAFTMLHVISNCLEMKPLLSLRIRDFEDINNIIASEEANLLQKSPNPWDLDYDEFLRSIKTAAMFLAWMEESSEDTLLEKFNITPGELRVRMESADWLLYSTQELGLLLNYMDILKHIRKIRLRVKHGIREELLPLIRLKGIGRVRARKLWASNIKSLDNLRKIPIESLARILGPSTANEVKEQLG